MFLPRALRICGFVLLLVCSLHAAAQAVPKSVPAILLSDLHFDPFHDPAKFQRLHNAPAKEWQRILSLPDAKTQPDDLAGLRNICKLRGTDTPWTLLESSLAASRAASPQALFVTVSGDMMAHSFQCDFKALAPKSTDADYAAFAAKSVTYVNLELHRFFPKTPIYMALGNNDSGCGDYRESPQSAFLRGTADAVTTGTHTLFLEERAVRRNYSEYGDYSVALPKPIERGRLIVLQDIYLSRNYNDCGGKPSSITPEIQMEWLSAQLAEARTRQEQVWVMGHIPPGVDLYSTIRNSRDVCKNDKPEMFLRDERLAEVLTLYADVIRLALFAHSHMDEMRLLQPPKNEWTTMGAGPVAVKLVPSVSPINGNNPAFTLAEISPRTVKLLDFTVVAADNQTGVDTKWTEEYRYSTAYAQKDYSTETLKPLMQAFTDDVAGTGPVSSAYEHNFFVGAGVKALAMRLVWPSYVCTMTQDTPDGYSNCLCKQAAAAASGR